MIATSHIPLFVEPVKIDVEKVAEFKLSDNVNKWETELIEHINNDLPFLSKIPYEIQLKNVDKELGYALGSVVLKIPDTQAAIPIIIKKRKLQCLDVLMIGEEEAMPLSEDTLLSLVQKKQTFGKLTDVKNDGLIDRISAGSSDESGHMPPNFGKYTFASVYNANDKQIAEFNELIKEATFAAGFKARNTIPQIQFLPRTKTNSIKKVAGHVIQDPKNILNVLEKTGSALVVDAKNDIHKGIFIDNVQTFDGEKVAQKLFISKDSYAFQEKIAGRSGSFKVSGETDYSINDEVVFVINGVATEPVKVASKLNGEKLACVTHLGQKFNVYLTNVSSITKTAAGYMIPKKATIIKLGKRFAARTSDDAILKTAQAKLGNKTIITCAPESYSFSNEKVGTFNNLPKLRMQMLMSGFYENGHDLLDAAEKTGSAVLSGIDMGSSESKLTPPNVLSIEDSVKLAANLADPDSVDAILSLGFINEDNVADFVEMIPQLEEVVNHLAKILISVRLGMAGDQNVIKHAMKYLQRVIDNLKALR